MLNVVSNTTPLISLLKLNQLEILNALYTEVVIPTAVFQEVENGKNKKYYRDLSEISWIKIQNIQDKFSIKYNCLINEICKLSNE